MKKALKFLLVLLSIIIVSAIFSSCSQSDVPEGYQLVAREGDEFRLYIPTQGWMPNTTSGLTSAYWAMSTDDPTNPGTSVSVYVAADAGEFIAQEKLLAGTTDENGEVLTRESLEKQWNETLGSAAEAAYAGEIDDIIPADELRARLIAAVEMLSSKSKLVYDKRHANLPL